MREPPTEPSEDQPSHEPTSASPRNPKRARRSQSASSLDPNEPSLPVSSDPDPKPPASASASASPPASSPSPNHNRQQLQQLAKASDRLGIEVESLKYRFTTREDQVQHLLSGLGALPGVEQELKDLQAEYRQCATKDVALVHGALERVAECLRQVDAVRRAGNLTSLELQHLRGDCDRHFDAWSHNRESTSSLNLSLNTAATEGLNANATANARVEELWKEVAACKAQLGAAIPRREEMESEFFSKVEAFSAQLDHLRLLMSKMEQDLLQETELSRKGLEGLLAQQMALAKQQQAVETKRMQDEMDDLRTNMCEILKEMHLLKERTKYLGPDARCRSRPRYPVKTRRHSTGHRSLEAMPRPMSPPFSPFQYDEYARHETRELQLHEQYCQYYHSQAPPGIGIGIAMAQGIDECTSAVSSPRRPADVMDMQDAQRMLNHDHEPPQSYASPHYSSRSSSVSGRISVTREKDGKVNSEELERRLLEQHRLFWVSEGAASGVLPSSPSAQLQPNADAMDPSRASPHSTRSSQRL